MFRLALNGPNILAVVLVAGALPALAQDTATADATADATDATDETVIGVDTDAVAAVSAMGDYLRGLGSFTLSADLAYDDTLFTGDIVQRNEHVEISARLPDRLAITTTAAERNRELFYDGSTVTLFARTLGFYAQIEAPPTIREMVATAAEHGFDLPLSDLFLWGTDDTDVAALTSGFYVGPAQIGDRMCDQYAFSQDTVDWQIWIQQGDAPLPCKLLIVDNYNETFPQYSATITLTPDVTLADDLFIFAPPEGATRVQVMRPDALQ